MEREREMGEGRGNGVRTFHLICVRMSPIVAHSSRIRGGKCPSYRNLVANGLRYLGEKGGRGKEKL